ncbi:MAG: hypothetical protein K2G45_05700 [Lachnospiraceae bacterium]|nr:hypothetical protein [Lachnospiraceae bacterium]
MAGFGTLLLGALLGISKIKDAIDNADAMSTPINHLDDGTPVYMNNKLDTYINGEKIVTKYAYDINGDLYLQRVGEISGRVYNDPVQNQLKIEKERDRKNLEFSKKLGLLAYEKYNPKYKRQLTTEISTGKVIAVLYKLGDEYRKFYLNEKCSSYNKSAPGDFGILISKEEYNKLNIVCSHGNLPDADVREELYKQHGMFQYRNQNN